MNRPLVDHFWNKQKYFFLTTAILFTTLWSIYCPTFDPDHLRTEGVVHVIASGNGINEHTRNADDLSKPQYFPFLFKSPGYPTFLYLMKNIFRDQRFTNFAIKAFSIFLFFISWFLLLELLVPFIGNSEKFIVWFIWSFISNPLLIMRQDEMISIALFSISIYLTIYALKHNKLTPLISGLIGLVLGLSAATRYASWILGCSVPIALLAVSVWSKKKLWIPSLIMTTTYLSILGFLLLFNWYRSGQLTCMDAYNKGWALKNLLLFYPFPATILGLDFHVKGFAFSSLPINFLTPFVQLFTRKVLWISSIFMVVLWVLSCERYRRKFLPKSDNDTHGLVFLLIGGISFLLLITMHGYVSIRYIDTYASSVAEYRYFAPLFPFILIGIISSLVHFFKSSNIFITRFVFLLLSPIILLVSHNSWIQMYKMINNMRHPKSIMSVQNRLESIVANLKEEKRIFSNLVMIYEPINLTDYCVTQYSSSLGIPFHYHQHLSRSLSTSQQVQLLILYDVSNPSQNSPILGHLVHNFPTRRIGQGYGRLFYSISVPPGTYQI